MASPSFEDVARAFVTFYYQTFDTNREALGSLYQDQSLMTWQSEKFQGRTAIIAKLVALPFTKVAHEIISCDSQPSVSGGIMVFVNGNLTVDDGEYPLKYSQVFHLMPAAGNSFWVTNDLFCLA